MDDSLLFKYTLRHDDSIDQYFLDYGYFTVYYIFDEVEENYFYEVYVDGNLVNTVHPTGVWTLDEAVESSRNTIEGFFSDAKHMLKNMDNLDMEEVKKASRIYKETYNEGN